MTHAKSNFNQLMLTLIFSIWASEPPPRAWRTTEKAGPDRVKSWTFYIIYKVFDVVEVDGVVRVIGYHQWDNTRVL